MTFACVSAHILVQMNVCICHKWNSFKCD